MNRMKKEEIRKYKAARKGLTEYEVVDLDRREAQARAVGCRVESLHRELFPEEYDWFYDDAFDKGLRSQGINPMSESYIERTNADRAALGFDAYDFTNTALSKGPSTKGWVRQMVCDGREGELELVLRDRSERDKKPNS